MEFSNIFQENQNEKRAKKNAKTEYKNNNIDIFTGFEKNKRTVRGERKIAANNITIQTRTLNNAVRSVFASKEQVVNIEEHSKALINEDLFQIIDLSNHKEKSNSEDKFRNKSIFKEIEDKFRAGNVIEPYLISDENLQKLISKQISTENNLILNCWSKTLENFVLKSSTEDAFSLIFNKIVNNQSRINESCALLELKTKFRGVSLSGTCLRRKFIRRCNQLLNMQKLGDNLISSAFANDLIHRANLELELNDEKPVDSAFKLKVVSTPGKKSESLNLQSNFSFHTPENQKLRFSDLNSVSLFQPAVLSNANYIELDKNKCLDDKFCYEHGLSKEQQTYFLNEAIEKEKQQFSVILERPKKIQTVRKVFTNVISTNLTPISRAGSSASFTLNPNRRLDFSDVLNENHSENIDFCLLEDVGKPNKTPLRFGGLLSGNGAQQTDKFSPKRGLEMLLSPNELKLRKKIQRRQETICSQAKRFAFNSDAVGPVPKAQFHSRFMP